VTSQGMEPLLMGLRVAACGQTSRISMMLPSTASKQLGWEEDSQYFGPMRFLTLDCRLTGIRPTSRPHNCNVVSLYNAFFELAAVTQTPLRAVDNSSWTIETCAHEQFRTWSRNPSCITLAERSSHQIYPLEDRSYAMVCPGHLF
jgi:hypothetical protein